MSMPDSLRAFLMVAGLGMAAVTGAQDLRLGVPITEADLQSVDLIIQPDGTGLPAGSGTAQQGRQVFTQRCSACHGAAGEGANPSLQLVGGSMQSEGVPVRTVGSYWPYATTLFDYIRRAMPANEPKSLTADEVYQVSAFLLFLNGVIAEDAVINAQTLPQVKMPNRDGFIDVSHRQ